MPKIPPVPPEKMLKILKALGFREARQRGSHVVMKRDKTIIVVPIHKNRPLKRGLVRLIMKEAGISREEFFELLKKV